MVNKEESDRVKENVFHFNGKQKENIEPLVNQTWFNMYQEQYKTVIQLLTGEVATSCGN